MTAANGVPSTTNGVHPAKAAASSASTSTFGAAASNPYATTPTAADPYAYQTGFGNRFASEAVPSTLPLRGNTPQKLKYDLYSEQLNGSAFATIRREIQNVWMYRIRPSVAHRAVRRLPANPDIQATFTPLNPAVSYVPAQLAWDPFHLPAAGDKVDFVQGIKTVGGNGDPTQSEGLAIHVYAANASMGSRAYCSTDGDMLIMPQQGRLDVQTEMGRMMVAPGELCVVQKGIRFKVELPDGPSRGYIQEVWGSHYELPELGPLGSNGMAHPRDFCHPLASFDLDQSPWEIIYKMCGQLYVCHQKHTPFDVVAWHGNYVPYKYDIEKFINVGNVSRDQMDPTVYCVLTARSKVPHVAISDLLVFTDKMMVNMDTFRPPYYHRNMSSEVMGLIYGQYGGSSHVLQPGGLSLEPSFMPHGETHDTWVQATTAELKPVRVCEGTLCFMLHVSSRFAVTEWAMERSGALHESAEEQWDDMAGHFLEHLDEVNADLRAAGRPALGELA